MSQVALLVAIQVLGLAVCLALGPRRRPALCCALGFPVGLVVTVVIALAILVIGLPYRPWLLGTALLGALAVALVAAGRRVDRATVTLALAWTAGFALAALVLTTVNVTVMSYDSHQLAKLARVIAVDGALEPGTLAGLSVWGGFQVVAQSTAMLIGEDLLHALPPLFGLSFVPMFALALWHGVVAAGAATRPRVALVALVTAVLFSLSMVAYHVLYLHTNGAAAVYLFGFVTLFWLAEVERDAAPVPLAFVCLTGFALQRTETPVIALLFLALTVTRSQLPRRPITLGLAAFTVVIAVWYEVLARHVPDGGDFLTPARCRLVSAAVLAGLGWWLASSRRPIAAVNRWLPAVVVVVVALALVAAFASRGEHMLRSADSWQHNLRYLPHWGQSWYAIVVLALLGLGLDPPKFRAVFVIGVPVYLAVMLLLAYGGAGYRIGLGDSANRMTIHVVPLIFFYLGLKTIPAVTR